MYSMTAIRSSSCYSREFVTAKNNERQGLNKPFALVNFLKIVAANSPDALTRSVTYHHTWVRVGNFDLPQTIDVITASAGKQDAFRVTLSNHKLAK